MKYTGYRLLSIALRIVYPPPLVFPVGKLIVLIVQDEPITGLGDLWTFKI